MDRDEALPGRKRPFGPESPPEGGAENHFGKRRSIKGKFAPRGGAEGPLETYIPEGCKASQGRGSGPWLSP